MSVKSLPSNTPSTAGAYLGGMFAPYNLTPFISVYVPNWPLIHACCTLSVIKTCSSSILSDSPSYIHIICTKVPLQKTKCYFHARAIHSQESKNTRIVYTHTFEYVCVLRSKCTCYEINLSLNGKRRQFLIYHLVKVVQVHFPSFPVLLPPLICIRQRTNMAVHECAIVLGILRFFSASVPYIRILPRAPQRAAEWGTLKIL